MKQERSDRKSRRDCYGPDSSIYIHQYFRYKVLMNEAYQPTNTLTPTHPHTHTYPHTHIHRHTHTHTHTHTQRHTYTHTHAQ